MFKRSAKPLVGYFKSEEDLHVIRANAPAMGLPAGWQLLMPMGGRGVCVDMFVIEAGVRGAYQIRVSHQWQPITDEWELAAYDALTTMVRFFVTDRDPITKPILEAIALAFHQIWTTGHVGAEVWNMRGAFPTEVDQNGMCWVGVRRARE